MRRRRGTLAEVDGQHGGAHETIHDGDGPHDALVQPSWVEQLREENHDGELWSREGEDAGDERDDGEIDSSLNAFGRERCDMPASAGLHGHDGEGDIEPTEDLKRARNMLG